MMSSISGTLWGLDSAASHVTESHLLLGGGVFHSSSGRLLHQSRLLSLLDFHAGVAAQLLALSCDCPVLLDSTGLLATEGAVASSSEPPYWALH